MSTVVYRNAKLEINGVDYSPDVSELSVNFSSEMLDETAMGDSYRIKKGGLKNWSVDVTAHQDFSANHVGSSVLWNLVGTTVCWEIRPQNSCSTAINPIFSGIGIIDGLTPMQGAVGSLLDTKFTIQCASDVNRASSS